MSNVVDSVFVIPSCGVALVDDPFSGVVDRGASPSVEDISLTDIFNVDGIRCAVRIYNKNYGRAQIGRKYRSGAKR